MNLGQTKSQIFDDWIIISISKKYLKLNHDLPIIFNGEIKNGKLILCGKLAGLRYNKEVDDNAM